MADYTLTPANVLASTQATTIFGTAGAALTAGQPLYQDTADLDASGRGKWKLADANGASATIKTMAGVALHAAASGQPVRIALGDPDYTHGLTTVAAGDIVILSATAGAFAPAADLATGMRANVALVATSATKGVLRITTAGADKA
jgi:hypothetical protein